MNTHTAYSQLVDEGIKNSLSDLPRFEESKVHNAGAFPPFLRNALTDPKILYPLGMLLNFAKRRGE
jgi:uncharacterized protein YjgD (DUF1641 family)